MSFAKELNPYSGDHRVRVALTFDDGPHPIHTPVLLDIAVEHSARFTFFVIGALASKHKPILLRMIMDGHEIGNHSWSHPQMETLSQEQLEWELLKTQEVIIDACKVPPKLMRPPYGQLSYSQKLIAENMGYGVALWNVDTLDWQLRDPSQIAARMIKGLRPNAVILLHDISKFTIEAIRLFFAQCGDQFHFVSLSDLRSMLSAQ